MKAISLIRSITLLSLLFALQKASGAQVNWGTNRLASNFTSDLQTLGSENAFTFEVGSFAPGFVPSPENVSDWAANWIAADSAPYRIDFRFAAGSTTGGEEIAQGSRGYIWGFDSRESDEAEWILLSDPSWTWQMTNDTTPPQDWSAGGASESVVGALGGEQDAFHLRTSAVRLGSVPQIDPEAWRSLHFAGELDSEIAAWGADADADGIANALEFVFDTSPRDPGEAVRADVRTQREGDADYLALRFDAAPIDPALLVVEQSHDLKAWSAAGPEVLISFGENHFEVRDTRPVSGATRRFFRLRAAISP